MVANAAGPVIAIHPRVCPQTRKRRGYRVIDHRPFSTVGPVPRRLEARPLRASEDPSEMT